MLLLWMMMTIAGCESAPGSATTSLRHEPEAEALAGRTAALALELRCGGVQHEPAIDDLLNRTAIRLAGVAPVVPACDPALLASRSVNAYSLPGGLVYFTRGLYTRLDGHEELVAAVMAHEMAHILHKDSFRPADDTPEAALDRELTADRDAARRLADAGYAPDAVLRLLEIIRDVQPPGWAVVRETRLRTAIQESATLAAR